MGKKDNTLIFIVEDDNFYAKAISKALESKNYVNHKTFKSGEECISHLHMKPDIILLDYLLGAESMDGMEVLKIIKQKGIETKVVFLTSVDKLEIATNTIKSGAYDYVVKSEAAIERIRNIIRRITFEENMKKENALLKRSRNIILFIIGVLTLIIVAMTIFQLLC